MQVWAPQTVTDTLSVERVQRRTAKFILSLPYRTTTTYRERLRHEYYRHEYLFIYKSSFTRVFLATMSMCQTTTRTTRNANPVNGILLNVSRYRTVTFENNFYARAPSVWNILPSNICDTSRSIAYFKNSITISTFSNKYTTRRILEHLSQYASISTHLGLLTVY